MNEENNETVEQNEETQSQASQEKVEEQTETSETETAQESAASENEGSAENPQAEQPKSELELANEKIAQLEKENAELKDQVLRRAADFDNYRKRMILENQEARDFANTSLLKDLLDSLDNFDRTIQAAETATDPKTIADGISMINKSMVSMLENKYNLVSYGSQGDAFDPELHEAIGSVEEEGVTEQTLKDVYLKGYKLKDRVIRHAKVRVSVPKA